MQDFEPAVVEKLADASFGRDEIMRVVHVPEEFPFLQVVGDHHEQDPAWLQRAPRFSRKLAGVVYATHVLEHLVRIDHVGRRVIHRHRGRPRLDDLQTLVAEHVDQDGARFDRGVVKTVRDREFAQRAVPWTDLEEHAAVVREPLEQVQPMPLDARTPPGAVRGQALFGKGLVEGRVGQGLAVSRWSRPRRLQRRKSTCRRACGWGRPAADTWSGPRNLHWR